MNEYEFSTPPITPTPEIVQGGYFLNSTEQQEEFSVAYIHSIVAAAGYSIDPPRIDKDSIDLVVRQHNNRGRYPIMGSLHVQAKCTYHHVPTDSDLPYSLLAKNYNDLRDTVCAIPKILVVVHVPRDFNVWLRHDITSMTLQHHAYWHSLRGELPITTASTTIHIPLSQRLTVEALRGIMDRLAVGGLP